MKKRTRKPAKKRSTLPKLIAEQPDELTAMITAASGKAPDALCNFAEGYMAGRDPKFSALTITLTPRDAWRQSIIRHLVNAFLDTVKRRDSKALHRLAETVKRGPDLTVKDPLRFKIESLKFETADEPYTLDKHQVAAALNYKGDVEYLVRICKECRFPLRKGKGGAPRKPHLIKRGR